MKANMVTRQINLPCSISVCLQFNSILVYLKDQGYWYSLKHYNQDDYASVHPQDISCPLMMWFERLNCD